MKPDIETATKEPLSFNNRFISLYENVVYKHTMLCDMTATEMAWPDEFNFSLPKPVHPLPAP
jgi:hypothetical protein